MACQLICPNLRCRKIVRAAEDLRGQIVRCPNCHCMLRVPPARPEKSPPPAGVGPEAAVTQKPGAVATADAAGGSARQCA
jgi:hypothetical protein